MIRYKIIEFARPTINRNDALTAAPVERLVGAYKYGDVVRLMVFELTNDTADLTDAIKAIVDICAYRNSHILITSMHYSHLEGLVLCRGPLTTTITMVLCPKEKNKPQVTGS